MNFNFDNLPNMPQPSPDTFAREMLNVGLVTPPPLANPQYHSFSFSQQQNQNQNSPHEIHAASQNSQEQVSIPKIHDITPPPSTHPSESSESEDEEEEKEESSESTESEEEEEEEEKEEKKEVLPPPPSPPRVAMKAPISVEQRATKTVPPKKNLNYIGSSRGGKPLANAKSHANALKKAGFVRHRKVHRDSIKGISKPEIKRLARRGGVKRIAGEVYDEIRTSLKEYLTTLVQDSVTYSMYRRNPGMGHACTVTTGDVLMALKKNNKTLYDY